MRTRIRAWVTAWVLAALAGWAARAQAEPAELHVFAAASLRESFEAIARELERTTPNVRVRLAFAGSNVLRAQIEQGARAEVFASADPAHVEALARAGLVEPGRVFARNRLVVVVPAGSSVVKSFADLPRARYIVLGAKEVPAGQFADQAITRADAALGGKFAERVASKVVSREPNVRQVLAKVTLGEADAAIVYETDARAAGDKVRTVPIPPAWNVVAACSIAVARGQRDAALARAFVALAEAPFGRKVLGDAGFLPP